MVRPRAMTVHSLAEAREISDSDELPFVGQFEDQVRANLMRHAAIVIFQKNDRILEAGEKSDELPIILSGIVELRGALSNPYCGLLLLTRGDMVFPMAVLHDEPCLTSATALSRCRVLMLPRSAVIEQADRHPKVGMALARVMGAQWRMAVRHIIDLQCRSAPARLTSFLLKLVDFSDADIVEVPFPKGTLAMRLGISPETLSRAIQVVADNGVVLRGSQIMVRDRVRAEEFCGPEPYADRGEGAFNVHAF